MDYETSFWYTEFSCKTKTFSFFIRRHKTKRKQHFTRFLSINRHLKFRQLCAISVHSLLCYVAAKLNDTQTSTLHFWLFFVKNKLFMWLTRNFSDAKKRKIERQIFNFIPSNVNWKISLFVWNQYPSIFFLIFPRMIWTDSNLLTIWGFSMWLDSFSIDFLRKKLGNASLLHIFKVHCHIWRPNSASQCTPVAKSLHRHNNFDTLVYQKVNFGLDSKLFDRSSR